MADLVSHQTSFLQFDYYKTFKIFILYNHSKLHEVGENLCEKEKFIWVGGNLFSCIRLFRGK